MNITIALAQMALTLGEPETNYQKVNKWVGSAADGGADMILLPELWASGFDLKNSHKYASSLEEGYFARMSSLAKEQKIAVGGSLIEKYEDDFYNTFALYEASGELITFYRKVHLFHLLKEEQYFKTGNQLAMVDTAWGKIGLAICYDLRFPEMFRAYGAGGAELILVVAEWAQRRIEHWSLLLQARAVENQCFVAAVNKSGISQDEAIGGFSAIINPMGEYLAQGGKDEELLIAELNLKEVEKTRRWMPVMQDRKPEIYQKNMDE